MDNKGATAKSWNDEFRELTLQFVARLPSRITEMETALETGHLEEVAAFAHRLSGAAGSYSISDLATEARNLENVSRLKDIPSARKSFEKIQSIVSALKSSELPDNTTVH